MPLTELQDYAEHLISPTLSTIDGVAQINIFGAKRFAVRVRVLPVTEDIARRAGELRAQMALIGQVRQQPDMLIAATAQVHALTLVTRNVRDFDDCGIAVLNPFMP